MMTTHSGSFKKFEFEIHAGISSNTLWAENGKAETTVADAVPVRLAP
jgi:hypothetical protein